MELLKDLIDIVLHLDSHLAELIANYGAWTYAILFLIIFCETGLVIFPILPGDSLLFAAGALAATTELDVHTLAVLLTAAAVLGDSVNYAIGKRIGPKVFHYEDSKFFNKQHLIRTHEFYERYGGVTIIVARFIPIIRTFAPFVAGIGAMTYSKFILYNIFGGIFWIVSLLYAGYFFGNIPIVKDNFSLVILAIIFISILPGLVAYLQAKIKRE
ncbi:DedA family protein [bacterium]|nr:MAG: DedA family protein [bacterium]